MISGALLNFYITQPPSNTDVSRGSHLAFADRLGGNLFCGLNDWVYNMLVIHLLQDLLYSFSAFSGDLSSGMLDRRDGGF